MRFPENYQYINLEDNMEDVIFIISQPNFNLAYAPAFHHHALWVEKSVDKLERLVKANKYGIIHCGANGIILKKGHESSTKESQCFQTITLLAKEKLSLIKAKSKQ